MLGVGSAEAASQIKSKSRVRDLAEVFTAKREVNAMLDLVKDESYRVESRFLEPSCGNGNFLEEILLRKLHTVAAKPRGPKSIEFQIVLALCSTYGVDIDPQNVKEARLRLRSAALGFHASKVKPSKRSDDFDKVVDYILGVNIIEGDMINRVADIRFTEFVRESKTDWGPALEQRVYRLIDLMGTPGDLFEKEPPMAISVRPAVSYTKLWEEMR